VVYLTDQSQHCCNLIGRVARGQDSRVFFMGANPRSITRLRHAVLCGAHWDVTFLKPSSQMTPGNFIRKLPNVKISTVRPILQYRHDSSECRHNCVVG